jgi:hypothetical protein
VHAGSSPGTVEMQRPCTLPTFPATPPPPPPSLPYKVDTSRPSLRTNWTRRDLAPGSVVRPTVASDSAPRAPQRPAGPNLIPQAVCKELALSPPPSPY